MRFTLLITRLITAAVGFSPSPQATAEKPHIKIIKGAVHPGPPLEPQQGEKFGIDPATGDVLVEYRMPDGSLTSQRIEVATKVKPEVDAHWELAAAGLVRYSYVLKNQHGAEQNVGMFTVAMSDPELISNIKAPPEWRASGVSLAEWGTPSGYNWWPGDYQQGIPPGGQAGPFSFESPHLPGLTHLYVQGRVGSESRYSRSGMSEWMIEQAFEKIRFENNTVHPPTIGPVIPIGPDVQAGQVIDGIRSHVMPVMGRRELREWEPQLTALVNLLSSGDRTATLNVRPALARMGTTPLQQALFSAIVFNLDYVSKMPITAAVGFSQSPQATAEKPHIKIFKGQAHPGPPLEPQEGEKFEVDPATGDVLVEYRKPDGFLASEKIEVATKVKPEVDARWELAAAGLVRYSYVLKNLQGAEQNVDLFAVAMSDPELISNIKSPPDWRTTGVSRAEWGTPSRYNWNLVDYQQGTRPGAQAGPFSFESPHLPGLTHLYVQGRVGSESRYSRSGMSEWMIEQAFEKIRFENNTVQPLTIGPVIPIGPDVQAGQVIDGIRSHVMPIMGRREFREWEPQLTALVNLLSSGNRTAILDVRPALARMGTTPLQKAFFSAIAFNLDYVSKMP